jgi:hypothetical protein
MFWPARRMLKSRFDFIVSYLPKIAEITYASVPHRLRTSSWSTFGHKSKIVEFWAYVSSVNDLALHLC